MTYTETELYFTGLATWRVELFIENWDGASTMTKFGADALQIAKRELTARQS